MVREEKEKKRGFFSKLKDSLTRTRDNISGKVDQLVATYEELDDDFYEELTDILILADVGVKTTEAAVTQLREKCKKEKIGDPAKARERLGWQPRTTFEEMVREMARHDLALALRDAVVEEAGFISFKHEE